jgi:hypothetical protein
MYNGCLPSAVYLPLPSLVIVTKHKQDSLQKGTQHPAEKARSYGLHSCAREVLLSLRITIYTMYFLLCVAAARHTDKPVTAHSTLNS